MTTLAFSVARSVGTSLVSTAKSFALSYANRAISNVFDNRVFEGPRLNSFHLQTSRDGAPMARIYGRVRLAGQVIWASRLKEIVTEERVQNGKGGGPKQRNYSYTISFAIGLCEGEILGVDRLWANGAPLQIPGLTMRVYKSTDAQLPDPIISAIEGSDVPAFRGTAYLVFEDFPLDDFGARLPQINAEIIRVPPAQNNDPKLETMVKGVNLLPASGEFAYSTEIVEETPTPGTSRPINMNNLSGVADIELALDQLETQLPNCRNVSIVTAWFGTDLRCGTCEIKPGVETKTRVTPDVTWRVGGEVRGTAYLVSQSIDGRPNFGGTPSDSSILQAITALKARGFKVTLYPFILMDIPSGNGLPDPYGGSEQAAFPWRGRITCNPVSAENSAAVNAQIGSFFGAVQPSHFGSSNGEITYTGPAEFSYRRFILHYAKLAQVAGVDRFVIGSEMVGLTTLRGANTDYPAVTKLAALAQDTRTILGSQTALTYAADWSEYFGHHPQDSSGDVAFHLDPLWSSPAIDAIGIDAYFPLSDWRDGTEHSDTDLSVNIYDISYLKSQMESGEGYDYFYASQTDRDAQTRSPISDGAAGKPWVFRYKDLRNWWSQPHYNRQGGVELTTPTNWTSKSKPIWLMEIGCPAINKGSNQPNVFYDSKSGESNYPYYSTASRDDLIQRRYLEAFIDYWSEAGGNNPQSPLYGAAMIDTDMVNVWAWDARPFPDFPARDNIWSDGLNWQRGHWLSGRMGLIPLPDVVQDLCAQSGLGNVDVTQVNGLLQGYHIDRPMPGRNALAPLAAIYDFAMIETAAGLRFASSGTEDVVALSLDDIAHGEQGPVERIKASPEDRMKDARVHFIDAARDYQLGLASARDLAAETVRVVDIQAPIVMDASFARFTAETILARSVDGQATVNFQLADSRLDIEVGDSVSLPGQDGFWRVEVLGGLTTQSVKARRVGAGTLLPPFGSTPDVTTPPNWTAKPVIYVLDIPGDRNGPLVGAGLSPFSLTEISGPNSAVTVESPARIGALLTDLPQGPTGRWDKTAEIEIFLPGLALSSISDEAVLAGENRFAIETDDGWEILQAGGAELITASTYRLTRLLRGQSGTDADMMETLPSGARVVWLGSGWQDLPLSTDFIGEIVTLNAEAAGRAADPLEFDYKARHLRPLAPVHAKIRKEGGQIHISWIRRTRQGGDSWSGLDVPLGEETEVYRVRFYEGESVIAEYVVSSAEFSISETDIIMADRVSIVQGSQGFGWGASITRNL